MVVYLVYSHTAVDHSELICSFSPTKFMVLLFSCWFWRQEDGMEMLQLMVVFEVVVLTEIY